VRSLSGQGPKAARNGRDDHLRTPSPAEALTAPILKAQRDEH
jgi:hypothetical protein